MIAEFIGLAFNGVRGEIFLESIDFSRLFDVLRIVVDDTAVDAIKDLPEILPQVARAKVHVEQFREFLGKATELGLYDVQEMARILPDLFQPRRVLALRLRSLMDKQFSRAFDELLRSSEWSPADVFAEVTNAEAELHDALLANCPYFISLLAGKSAPQVEELLKVVYRKSPDQIFAVLKSELESNSKTSPGVLRLLLWVLKQRNHPRTEPLPGLDKQSPSEDLNALMCFFGSDQLLGQFSVTFAEGSRDILRKMTTFLPALEVSPDEAFLSIVRLPEWTRIVSSFRQASKDSEFELAERVIRVLLDRPSALDAVHALVVGLVLPDKQPNMKYLMKVAPHFPKLRVLRESDIEPLHAVAAKLLSTAVSKEADEILGNLLPPAIAFLKVGPIAPAIAEKLTFREKPLIDALGKKPPLQSGGQITSYVLACISVCPAFRDALKLAAKTNIQPSRLSINPLPVYQAVLLAGPALLDPALSIDEVVNQVYIVSKPVVSAGVETQLPMMYKFYTDHAFGQYSRFFVDRFVIRRRLHYLWHIPLKYPFCVLSMKGCLHRSGKPEHFILKGQSHEWWFETPSDI
jgi:hypothetical protein